MAWCSASASVTIPASLLTAEDAEERRGNTEEIQRKRMRFPLLYFLCISSAFLRVLCGEFKELLQLARRPHVAVQDRIGRQDLGADLRTPGGVRRQAHGQPHVVRGVG